MSATKRNLSTSSTDEQDSNEHKKLHTSVIEIEKLEEISSKNVPEEQHTNQEHNATGTGTDTSEEDIPPSGSASNTQMDNLILEEEPTMSTQEALMNTEPNTSLYEDALNNVESLDAQTVAVPVRILEGILSSLSDIKKDNADLRNNFNKILDDNEYLKIKLDELTTETRLNKCMCKDINKTNSYANRTQSASSTNENVDTSTRTTNTSGATTDTMNLKQQVVPNWGRKFNFRRKQFKNYDKNRKRADIYRKFINEESTDGLYIVKSLRPKFASDMRDYKLAEQLSIQSMKTQASRWEGYADQAKINIQSVDKQVSDLIKMHSNEAEKSVLEKKWENETKQAEEKAMVMNDNELEFMRNMPISDPYTGYVESVSEPRPNNGGFYKRHYYGSRRNSYNHNHHRNSNPQFRRRSNLMNEDQMDTLPNLE